MTPPVQQGHFVVGHDYQVLKFFGVQGKENEYKTARYMGEYKHPDGSVSHVFATPYFHEEIGVELIHTENFRDKYVNDYVKG
jgi:hypothetical protein